MEPTLRLSVHQLVDFLLRAGDIDTRVYNKASMLEGTRIHAFYQKKQGKHYISEYPLKETFEVDDFLVTLEGRADGIIVLPTRVIIDEIKSTVIDLDEFAASQTAWHLGQAECYALMYAHEKDLEEIDVRLTYISQVTDTQMVKEFHYRVEELEEKIHHLILEYLDFYRILYEKKMKRNQTAKELAFPFDHFRSGQRNLAKYAYAIATKGGYLFVEAPTGIGKTISTLYPFVHAFKEEKNEKIFYLTAKNSGKESALHATLLLKEKGFSGSVILITAKDKVCFQEGAACNPDECPFARSYYQKIQQILKESLLKYEVFDENRIIDIASKYEICPFELSLDLSLYTDIIVCDYNYAFDPLVYMKRYFDEDTSTFVALIDEAHNLVERGRSMYSVSVSYEMYKNCKKSLAHLEHKKMKTALKRMQKTFKKWNDDYEVGTQILSDMEETDLRAFDTFLKAGQDVLKNHSSFVDDAFLEFYFAINAFLKLYELYDESFALYIAKKDHLSLSLELLCLDPSLQLKRRLHYFRAAVIFSATLSPSDYYISQLGGQEQDAFLALPSPFPKENLLLMVRPNLSTKLRNRYQTLDELVETIQVFIKNKIGNYFVFFPSYEYLLAVIERLDDEDFDVVVQKKDMKEKEKIEFLNQFSSHPKRSTVGFVVLGGAFSEGIDLMGDRLIGAIVIGVGLPTISFERDLIKKYYDEKSGDGYLNSYVNPGMNRVMQAVGRVIRSENDRGMILLIDDRYLQKTYRDLFKNEWSHYEVVMDNVEMQEMMQNFWKEKEK